MKRSSTRYQRGMSLVEVAIASVILGACGALLWNVIDSQDRTASTGRSLSMVDRAHDAILAYAYLHRALPCPAQVTTGIEHCDGNSEGFLPYVTLGLPEPAAGHIRYRMAPDTRSPASSDPYMVVSPELTGANKDLVAKLVPLSTVMPDGYETLFDLCQALGSPAHSADVAYSLTPDSGMAASAAVQVVGRARLAAKLHCASLAVPGRAHFNTALAADTMNRAMEDILAQYEMVEFTAGVDLAQGIYFEANSLLSLHRANTKRLGALAVSEATNGVESAALSTAQISTAKAGIYTVALGLNVARFAINLAHVEARRVTLTALKAETQKTAVEIRAHATGGSSSAFFLEDKWALPAP